MMPLNQIKFFYFLNLFILPLFLQTKGDCSSHNISNKMQNSGEVLNHKQFAARLINK